MAVVLELVSYLYLTWNGMLFWDHDVVAMESEGICTCHDRSTSDVNYHLRAKK